MYDTDAGKTGGSEENCESVLEQLFYAYRQTHDFDTPDIKAGFRELDGFLESHAIAEDGMGVELVCRLCLAHEKRAFLVGVQYGAQLMQELFGV